MKQVAGSLKLELAQFRGLEAFSAFASDLDKASQAQLARGRRLVEVLKQGVAEPQSVEKQIAIIFAANKGFLDSVDEKQVQKYEKEFLQFLSTQHGKVLDLLKKENKLTEEIQQNLQKALEEFKIIFEKGNQKESH